MLNGLRDYKRIADREPNRRPEEGGNELVERRGGQ